MKRYSLGVPTPSGVMEWTRSGDDVFLRLDPGEEIHASLQTLADEIGFDAAAITSGIGRTRDSTYGYMDDDHHYHRRTITGGSELVTLQGNLARRENGDAFTHFMLPFQTIISRLMQAICLKQRSMLWPNFTFVCSPKPS